MKICQAQRNFITRLMEIEEPDGIIDFCRKEILHGCPYVFDGREDEYYIFKKVIADHFEVNYFDVLIVGSAKMGFSPHKSTQFSLESDVDTAIISEQLFNKMMEYIYPYQMALRRARRSVHEADLAMYHEFLEYTALGWIRPDKLPISHDVKNIKESWFNFFDSISNGKSSVGNYKVAAGVFKSYSHLERYTVDGLEQLRNQLKVKV